MLRSSGKALMRERWLSFQAVEVRDMFFGKPALGLGFRLKKNCRSDPFQGCMFAWGSDQKAGTTFRLDAKHYRVVPHSNITILTNPLAKN